MTGVGSLPGGAKLVELIEKVTADAAAIDAVAQRWRQAGATTESSRQALTSTVNGVDGAWQGPASDAFVGYLSGFTDICDGTNRQLDAAACVLGEAADLLQTTRRILVNRCDALVSEAASAVAGMTDQDQINAVQAGLVDQVYSELVPMVDEADSRLAGLAGQLAEAPGNGFAGYPEPGTANFVPQPGQPTGWQIQPPETAPTSPQAATGSTPPASDGSTGGGPAGGGPAAGGPTGGGPAAGGGPVHGGSTYGGHHGGGSAHGAGGGGSSGGFGGYGPSGPPPPGSGPAPQGQVAEWIKEAIEILKAQGYPVDKMNPNDIWLIIQHESGGDPNAINNWDSNAARGTPSKGLMQTIDPTFNSHSLPGHNNIYNPVDNIIAGVRYAIDRYGSVSNVPGVVGVNSGSSYRGY